MPKGRDPIPADERVKLVNYRFKPDVALRLKIIAFRESIHRGKMFSESAFLQSRVMTEVMPPPPTQEKIDEYIRKWPKQAAKIRDLAALVPPDKRKIAKPQYLEDEDLKS